LSESSLPLQTVTCL